jgi:hypothetical protein
VFPRFRRHSAWSSVCLIALLASGCGTYAAATPQTVFDTATGVVHQTKDGQPKQDEIQFKRINGAWKIHLEMEEAEQGGGPALPLKPAVALDAARATKKGRHGERLAKPAFTRG